jgi:rhodanese-related sulfurtransferase
MTKKIKSPAHAEMMQQFRFSPILKGIFIFLFSIMTIGFANGQAAAIELPKEKQTTLKLYVTSKEAYAMWKTAPEKVKILDVRTNEEFVFVGHAAMAINIPAFLQMYQWDSAKKKLPMVLNPDFLASVKATYKTDDMILVTCRSGGRSAMAVNMMAQAGFKNVYNIIDGFEGDTINDPASIFNGQHMKNGWKNAGLPWTYEIDPGQMKLPY